MPCDVDYARRCDVGGREMRQEVQVKECVGRKASHRDSTLSLMRQSMLSMISDDRRSGSSQYQTEFDHAARVICG